MATMNAKNLMISPAATDLGLGDEITQQLQDQIQARKKTAVQAQQGVVSTLLSGASVTQQPLQASGAAQMLFGGISLG